MADTRLMDPAAATDKSAADKLPIPLIDARSPEPGFPPGERPFLQSQQQKTDTEAVQDWESEGGASTHPSENDLASNRKKPMKTQVGMWIDNREANIVFLSQAGEKTQQIKSNVEKQLRRSGDSLAN